MSEAELRWRKFSPIDRDFPIYELVEGDVVILDVTMSKEHVLEIAFHEGAWGRVFELGAIERLIAEVKTLLAAEEPT